MGAFMGRGERASFGSTSVARVRSSRKLWHAWRAPFHRCSPASSSPTLSRFSVLPKSHVLMELLVSRATKIGVVILDFHRWRGLQLMPFKGRNERSPLAGRLALRRTEGLQWDQAGHSLRLLSMTAMGRREPFFTSPVHVLLRGCSRSGLERSHDVSTGMCRTGAGSGYAALSISGINSSSP